MLNTHFIAAAIALATLTLAQSAHAGASDGGVYLRLFGGLSDLSSTSVTGAAEGNATFDTGGLAGGAVGYAFVRLPLRSEVEFTYRTADAEAFGGTSGGDFASTSLALNGYVDLDALGGRRFTPYLGAGISFVTEIDFDVTIAGTEQEFADRGDIAFQLMLGSSFAVTDRLSLNGEVRYFDAGSQRLSSDTGSRLTADYDAIEVIFGASFNF